MLLWYAAVMAHVRVGITVFQDCQYRGKCKPGSLGSIMTNTLRGNTVKPIHAFDSRFIPC